MTQFDVHKLESGVMVVTLQADLIDDLNVVVVAPLYPAEEWDKPARHLHPAIEFDGCLWRLIVNHVGAIGKSSLGKRLGSVAHHRHDIISALDFLFTGI